MIRRIRNKPKTTEIIMCVVLAILLSFSITLTLTLSLTGAWFTDSTSAASSSLTVGFGTVSVGNNSVQKSISALKPGDTIAYGGTTTGSNITYGGNVGAYYRIKISVSNNSVAPFINFTSNDAKVIYGELAPSGSITKGTITFSANATNDLQGLTFDLVVDIDVIQKDNLPSSVFDGNTINYTRLFTYYDSL